MSKIIHLVHVTRKRIEQKGDVLPLPTAPMTAVNEPAGNYEHTHASTHIQQQNKMKENQI